MFIRLAKLIDKVPRPGRKTNPFTYMTNVYTLPAYRSKGMGSQLLKEIEKWARKHTYMGNPAGVVLNADHLSEQDMLNIANSGTIEDPVTGTASGVMGAYHLTYMEPELKTIAFIVEQGQEINRDGRVSVLANKAEDGSMDIYISGHAVFVNEFTIEV